jgi:thymidylate synthase
VEQAGGAEGGDDRMSWGTDWTLIFKELIDHGEQRETRMGLTKEIIGFTQKFDNPHFQVVPGRGGINDFALTEQLCYLAGTDSEPLADKYPKFRRYKDVQFGWYGAYGSRLRSQLPPVVYELSRHSYSRRGVALIYSGEDTANGATWEGLDIPCTIALNFWREGKKLNCHVFMRSTDVWFGLYYDVPAFHAIQTMIASALGVQEGPLWFTTTSLHVYEKDWWVRPLEKFGIPEAELEWPEGLMYSDSSDPIRRLSDIAGNAKSILQTFYNFSVPLDRGHAKIGTSSADPQG